MQGAEILPVLDERCGYKGFFPSLTIFFHRGFCVRVCARVFPKIKDRDIFHYLNNCYRSLTC